MRDELGIADGRVSQLHNEFFGNIIRHICHERLHRAGLRAADVGLCDPKYIIRCIGEDDSQALLDLSSRRSGF